jgi:DnaD/phage-associated family protein
MKKPRSEEGGAFPMMDRFRTFGCLGSNAGAARRAFIMQIDESRKLLLSDTLVPDIFITEHLPALDGLAVKLYIYFLLTARSGNSVTEQDLARRLGTEPDAIRSAILELASRGLVALKDKGLEILDIKAAEIEKTYRIKTASTPLEAAEAQAKFTLREKLLADIAKTFFQGLMSPSWYGEIDSWFDRYGFEPEVIYTLFQECARRNKLDSKAYIGKVAENWAARGIKTFNDLNQYFLAHDQVSRASKKIGKKLRRTMTEYDEEYVARWIEKFGYDFDIIELALRKTTKQTNPNLEFIDRILEEWHTHDLKDAESIRQYEASKATRLSAAKKTGETVSQERRSGNLGNFPQREYSAEYLESFYEDVTPDTAKDEEAELEVHDQARPASMPGQIELADILDKRISDEAQQKTEGETLQKTESEIRQKTEGETRQKVEREAQQNEEGQPDGKVGHPGGRPGV